MVELKAADTILPDKTAALIFSKEDNKICRVEIGCTVVSDLKTIAGMCRGKVKPMSAFFNGKLRLEGDRKYFATVAAAFKELAAKRNVIVNA